MLADNDPIHPRVRAELAAMGCTPQVAAQVLDPAGNPPRGSPAYGDRQGWISDLRAELAWRLRQRDEQTRVVWTYPEIARAMQRPSHSAIIAMVRRHEARAKSAVTGGESEAA